MDACRVYRLGTFVKSTHMESLAYENATPLEVGPPPLRGEVWMLGRRYSLPREKTELTSDVKSRFWFTYRKNFKAISGTSITGDQGWGCTLRCGQMVMGNTLLLKHLGRGWRWPVNDKEHTTHATYMKILKMFLDKKDSEYSLHMIAHQGADFGRPIGQWFGPNNVAQALKKLATHESWTQLAVHVALDMVVVVEDMKALCREPHHTPRNVPVEVAEWVEKGRSQTAPNVSVGGLSHGGIPLGGPDEGPKIGRSLEDLVGQKQREVVREMAACLRSGHPQGGEDGTEVGTGGKKERPEATEGVTRKGLINGTERKEKRIFPKLTRRRRRKKESLIKSADFDHVGRQGHTHRPSSSSSSSSDVGDDDCFTNEVGGAEGSEFRSLLLFIPLRLGQEKFNLEYKEAVKACLTLPQSVGIIGGRPRHALYFIGYHGDSLLYLDPHTTQPAVSCSDTAGVVPDQSYHCSQPDRMNIADLDPSLALAFFCRDEADIEDLCRRLKECVLSKMRYMFDLTEKRPVYWGPVERNPLASVHEPFLLVKQAPPSPEYKFEEDSDGFEVIDYA